MSEAFGPWLRRLRAFFEGHPPADPFVQPAKGRMIYQGDYPVTEVILHTSATPPEWWHGKTVEQMRDMIDQWHRDRGWSGIGYHGICAPDGSWASGRPFTKQGAHVRERNRGTLGFCLIPSRALVSSSHIGRFEDYYTEAQREAVKAKIRAVSAMTDLRRVSGHNDFTDMKTCPGFKVVSQDWMP